MSNRARKPRLLNNPRRLARWPDSVVIAARDLYHKHYGGRMISKLLYKQIGVEVSVHTIREWTIGEQRPPKLAPIRRTGAHLALSA